MAGNGSHSTCLEQLQVWWLGSVAPWAQEALATVAQCAPVRIVNPSFLKAKAPQLGSCRPDLLIWEQQYWGQVGASLVARATSHFPLAGQVVLEGPLSALVYRTSDMTRPVLTCVPWHSWSWWWENWWHEWCHGGMGALSTLVPWNTHPVVEEAPRACFGHRLRPFSTSALLWIGDGELARWIQLELQELGIVGRWHPPTGPGKWPLQASPGDQVVFWHLGQWWPAEPQRELYLLGRILREGAVVILGTHSWLSASWPSLPLKRVIRVPLPAPAGAVRRAAAHIYGCSQ